MEKIRESNIELLRCVLMFMVIGLHIVGNGVLDNTNPIAYGRLNFFMGHFLESFFIMAVCCYVLISGYFGIRSNFKKLLTLYLPILFYSILFLFIIKYLFGLQFGLRDIVYFFPFLSTQYWFVTSYILLFLIAPLLNIILKSLTKFQLQGVLIICGLLFVLIPTFTPFTLTHDRGFGIINFIVLYFLGFYLRNYFNIKNKGSNVYTLAYIGICVLLFLINILFAKYLGYNKGWQNKFYGYDTIFVYISAISFFLIFNSLDFKSLAITKIAPLVFYIYIIHEHPLVREVLYSQILNSPHYYYLNTWILNTFFCMILVFISCLLIEFLRRYLLGGLENKFIEKLNCSYLRMKVILLTRIK